MLWIINGDEIRYGEFLIMLNDDLDYGGFLIVVIILVRICIVEVEVYWVVEVEEDR